MPIDYILFPSESLILGECVGEYTRRNASGGNFHFLDIAHRRLLPIIPSLREHKSSSATGAFVDKSRTSLMDAIFDELRESLALSKADTQFGLTEWMRSMESVANNLMAIYDEHGVASEGEERERAWAKEIFRRTGTEDRERVKRELEKVAYVNGYGSLFELGRAFGTCIADSRNAFEHISWLASNPIEEGEKDFSVGDFVHKKEIDLLLSSPTLSASRIAQQLLTKVKIELDIKQTLYEEWAYDATDIAYEVSASLWLAFGEVLGAVREMDEIAWSRDVNLPVPRVFTIRKDATRDEVKLALDDAEKRLNAFQGEAGQPEAIIRNLAPAIEALTKRIWRKDFAGRTPISDVLFQKSRNGTDLERRFSGVAQNLYKTYRNDVVHEMESFRCTFAEARYFVAGLRMLLELAEAILPQSKDASGN